MMKAPRLWLSALLLSAVAWGAVEAQTVSWIPGQTPPKQWAVEPDNPSTSDVITFSGPTDVFSNDCVGEQRLGGAPQIIIDSGSKTILLWFRPPAPAVCPMIWDPVAGLEGEFGPLAAGEWLFASLSKDLDFAIIITVVDTVAHHVDKDAPGPLHNGKTWNTAFLTLQDALAVANSGDVIRVAEGVYKPDQGDGVTPGDREATFGLVNGVGVFGGYAGYGRPDPDARDVRTYETVLDGDLKGNDLWGILNRDDNSYHVVTGPTGNPGAVLDGFTVTSGTADGAYPHHYGGGLYNTGGPVDIAHTIFTSNTAAFGGGIANRGAPITMVNTEIVGNRAFVQGGGLFNYEGQATMHNGRVVGNTADYAEMAGGAAIYNLNGTLTLANSTVADNLSPSGRAIASVTWTSPAGTVIDIANSILYNGGDEIGTNNAGSVRVRYSDVQGGWPGIGNISIDPQFIQKGLRSIEGEWIDGNYRLQPTSAAIDAGLNALVPPDIFDLDGDDDTSEPLPYDLDIEPRIEGGRVDMGAYEQLAKKPGPGPGPDVDLVFCVGDSCIPLEPDPLAPPGSNTFIGSVELEIELNFKGKFTAEVTPTSPAGGTWTGWLDPDVIGPGDVTTTLWVRGENLDLGALPGGTKDVQVAEVSIFVVPAP
jgi:hypothetical protein